MGRRVWIAVGALVGAVALLLVAQIAVLVWIASADGSIVARSGSMMHPDEDVRFGRRGTIDPGDIVLLERVEHARDVRTAIEGGAERFGAAGDVIAFRPGDDPRRPTILHRAIAYVEVEPGENGASYFVRVQEDATCHASASPARRSDASWCAYGDEGILLADVQLTLGGRPYRPESSGFVTQGDNPATNALPDQAVRLVGAPVPVEWIEGKARAEVPWLGLPRLANDEQPNEPAPPDGWTRVGNAHAPRDLWAMLWVALAAPLVVGAIAGALVGARMGRRV